MDHCQCFIWHLLKKKKEEESFKCKDCNRRDLLLKMNKTISAGFLQRFNPPARHPSHSTMVAWNTSAAQLRVIDNCCTVAACLPSSLWAANSSSTRGRSGWWLMSASHCDKPQLYAFCWSQTACYCSQICLISKVTVQLLNLASNNGIKRGETVWSALPFFTLET